VVAPEGKQYGKHKEYRKVAPLSDLMTYVELRTAGPNKIWGFISLNEKKTARSCYLNREYSTFSTDILEYDGSDWGWSQKSYAQNNPELYAESLPIVVPTGVFAKEPPEWEKTWVNLFFRQKPMDQCDYRRRRLFAYSAQPIIMFFNLLFRLVMLFAAAMVGKRGCSFKYLLHPIQYDMETQFDVFKGGCVFIRSDRDGDNINSTGGTFAYIIRKFWSLPFIPVFSIPTAIFFYFAPHRAVVVFAHIIGGLTGFILAGVLLICFIEFGSASKFFGGIARFLGIIGGGIHKLLNRLVPEKKDPFKPVQFWYLQQDEMEYLACKPDKTPMTFAKLPPKKRTFNLYFQEIKSKVCKPFSA
jgi:hypothetical protein